MVLILLLRSGSTSDEQRILIQDVSINDSTPLDIPSNYSERVRCDLINVTIWNPTVETYELLDHRVKILYLLDCSVSQVFLLPSLEHLFITNSNVSEIKIINWDKSDDIATGQIEVTNTSLKSLPHDINRLVLLHKIRWSNNDIGVLDLGVLNGLNNLKDAVITACSITEIPNSTAVLLPSLRVLELGRNQISHISTTRWTMPELRILSLEKNQLTELPILKHFHKLHTFDLNHNRISSLDQYQLFQLENLSTIILANNHLSQLDALGTPHFAKLIHLILNRNRLRRLDFRKWKLPLLKELLVENNQLRTVEGFEAIAGTLEIFHIDGNPWDCEWVHFAMVDLEEQLQLEWAKSC